MVPGCLMWIAWTERYWQSFEATKVAFGIGLRNQLFLLFNLFLLLFMGSITLFGTIHRSYCTISVTF